MWLSASAFFHQYFRVYSPIAFGKKTDKNGDYIHKYLPILKNYPTQYIYEPWTAPLAVQKTAKCIIGQDYPRPIVDHNVKSKANMARMKVSYEKNKLTIDDDSQEDKKDVKKVPAKVSATPKPSTSKQTTLDAFKSSPKTPAVKMPKASPPSPSTPSSKKAKKSD